MNLTKFFIALFLIPLIDTPWLLLQMKPSRMMFTGIQGGRAPEMRLLAAIPVYIALAFLAIQQTSMIGAALSGAAVYAVYDFTNLLVFKDYLVSFAIKDTIWGGVLFALTYSILKRF